MDDLISRQAAIDAFYLQSDDDGWWTGTAQDVEELLKGLPSAQPNVLEIGKWYKEGSYKVSIRRNYKKDYNEFCIQRDEDGFTKWERSVADSYRGEQSDG